MIAGLDSAQPLGLLARIGVNTLTALAAAAALLNPADAELTCQARKLDRHRWSRVAARTVTWPARKTGDGDHSLPYGGLVD